MCLKKQIAYRNADIMWEKFQQFFGERTQAVKEAICLSCPAEWLTTLSKFHCLDPTKAKSCIFSSFISPSETTLLHFNIVKLFQSSAVLFTSKFLEHRSIRHFMHCWLIDYYFTQRTLQIFTTGKVITQYFESL